MIHKDQLIMLFYSSNLAISNFSANYQKTPMIFSANYQQTPMIFSANYQQTLMIFSANYQQTPMIFSANYQQTPMFFSLHVLSTFSVDHQFDPSHFFPGATGA